MDDDESAPLDAAREQEYPPETIEQRRSELEAFFGTSLESYPAIVNKFMGQNSERMIDNAIAWLTSPRTGSDEHVTSEREDQQGAQIRGEEGGRPDGATEGVKEEEREARETKTKLALLQRIERIVGLGQDPLRELVGKEGFRVISSDVNMRREDLTWLTQNYDTIKSTFLLSTFSKKVPQGRFRAEGNRLFKLTLRRPTRANGTRSS